MSLNGGRLPHLFTCFRTAGSEEGDWEGGYNQLNDGWQQVSTKVMPGARLTSTSAFGGTQYFMDIQVRLHQGNWRTRPGPAPGLLLNNANRLPERT